MARTSQIAQVGKRKIELSNLQKVLYPDDHIVKAELIEYYLTIAPTILAHIKGRPLSLVRFPDGIDGEKFFQKNRPEWAPEWLEYVALGSGEEKKDYILATEAASLVWLANLACIELHQMHCRGPKYDTPDYFVFDLDPPETFTFPQVAELALELKEHIETYGYHPFVKTTGRRGLHILVPVEPKWTFEKVFQAAEAVAKPFVAEREKTTTLHLKKEYRKGRVFVDIFRNRPSQTIVAPYSVRGLPGASVSAPLTWDELPEIKRIAELNITSVIERVKQNGDPWEAIAAFAEPLHTEKKSTLKKKLPPSAKHKEPEMLEKYKQKRTFEKTPEPVPAVALGEGNAFVVHRHHASRLHYDLRLEQDGVLKSWAVPKGLPPRPGVMRLSVATEDHPLEYLNFEGKIPKGQYGGGEMWVYARGKYAITKEKKNGFYFRLQSKEVNAEYRTHQTKGNEWLLERVDPPQVDWLREPIEPMLAGSADKPPASGDHLYEVKWDGIRALISLDDGQLTIRTRNKMDITSRFPELLVPEQAFRATTALFDAEIVCLDAAGKPVFKNVIHRMQQTAEGSIERARAKYPAVCYVFDCLYLDGRPIMNEPLVRRRTWMADAIKRDTPYRVSEVVEDGKALFHAAAAMGLEGIMAKEKSSVYQPGKRTTGWLKIKTRQTTECFIIGYTKGKGNRESEFGALHLAQAENGNLRYVGKVGTGFDAKMMKEIYGELKSVKTIKRPVKEKPLDDASSTYIEPKLFCEVQYASWTKDKMLREPVFVRMRPDM
ncbi:MAG: non-homologous end-joining DNA ligase [Phycisphaeraceae bacterium]|nr:non-homologous end-joining DNA ligase [Bacteroidota bacterium]MCW5768134.1 non-homologous end-joining DNA ligase [Phycisphaeraceae bacterium]